MKLPNLIREVLHKTAPIDPTDLEDLNRQSALWYDQNIKEVKDKEMREEPLTLKDKIFKHLDAWYTRIGLAIAFFWIVRFIQQIMNPGDSEPEDFQDAPR